MAALLFVLAYRRPATVFALPNNNHRKKIRGIHAKSSKTLAHRRIFFPKNAPSKDFSRKMQKSSDT